MLRTSSGLVAVTHVAPPIISRAEAVCRCLVLRGARAVFGDFDHQTGGLPEIFPLVFRLQRRGWACL